MSRRPPHAAGASFCTGKVVMVRRSGAALIVALLMAGCGSVLHRVPPAGAAATPTAPAHGAPVKAPQPTQTPGLWTWTQGVAAPELGAGGHIAVPKRFWHWRITTGGVPGMVNERWIGVAGGAPTYFASGGTVHQADPADWGAHRFMIEGRALTFSEVSQLPSDQKGITAFLWAPYPTTQFTPRLFDQLIDVGLAPTPPATLTAAYRAIAQRPEVHYAGYQIDAFGRRGLGLVFEFDGLQNQLLVDPQTGAALSRRAVSLSSGAVQLATTVYLAEWTDSPPAMG